MYIWKNGFNGRRRNIFYRNTCELSNKVRKLNPTGDFNAGLQRYVSMRVMLCGLNEGDFLDRLSKSRNTNVWRSLMFDYIA